MQRDSSLVSAQWIERVEMIMESSDALQATTGILVENDASLYWCAGGREGKKCVCVCVGGGRAWFIHRGKKAEFDDLTVSNEMASGAALRAQSMQENVQIWEENLECIAVSQLSGYAAWGFGPNTLLQGCIN